MSPDEFKVEVEYNDKTIQIKKEVLDDAFENSGIHHISNKETVRIVNQSNSVSSTKLTFDYSIEVNQIKKKKTKQCDLCLKSFNNKRKLIIHMKHHFSGNFILKKVSKNVCSITVKCVYPKKISGQKNSFECKVCLKRFTDYSNCRRHIQNHYNIVKKTHTCHICTKSYTNAHNLKVHMRIHLNEKPFKCDTCQLAFFRKDTLQTHKRTHKTKYSNSEICCHICHKTFSSNSCLLRHTKMHKNKNPYTCDFCEQSFFRKDLLIVHIRSKHTGEKPHKCNVCMKSFFENSVLTRHKKIHEKK